MEYILSLGSNLGNRIEHIKQAIDHLNSIGKVGDISSLYETASWGYGGSDYLNLCLVWKPTELLNPIQILDQLQHIEHNIGRRRQNIQYVDRCIDIDIILGEKLIHNTERLEIPHSKMQDRNFVLIPLAEICPHVNHPIFNKSILEILDECSDTSSIKLYGKL